MKYISQILKSKSFPFYVFCIALFVGICSPFLFAEGMFLDGIIYAGIGKNLAIGKGSFWNPHFTETVFPSFHEHPPFVFWLESILYNIFGTESIYVERFFSFGAYVIIGVIMVEIWKLVCGEIKTAWFSILLLATIPTLTWAATNNLLENTMGVFIILGVYFYLKGTLSPAKHYLYVMLSGLALFFGVFSKGFVAFFPWSFPFWAWICWKKVSFRQCIIDTFLLVFFTIVPFLGIMFFSKTAYDSIMIYLNTQVFASLKGARVTVDNRFFIILRLLKELIIPIVAIITMLVIIKAKKISVKFSKSHTKAALTFLFLSLSGVLPVMLSPKQSGFYILPTFPLFAIAFGLFFQPYIMYFINGINVRKIGFKIFKVGSIVFFAGIIVFSLTRVGVIARDKKNLQIVMELCRNIPENAVVGINPELHENWGLQAYFNRKKGISLDKDTEKKYPFFLSSEESNNPIDTEFYQKMGELNGYTLYSQK